MSEFVTGCFNHYRKDEIEKRFCETDNALRICESCPFYRYDPRTGEIFCEKLNAMMMGDV